IKWEHLISIEQKMLMFFYRIANAFTDVPQLKEQVRSRSYLNGMLGFLSANKKACIIIYLREHLSVQMTT
ncbi:ABC transporter permease, partial [Alkalibacillus haloalkaliphilus]